RTYFQTYQRNFRKEPRRMSPEVSCCSAIRLLVVVLYRYVAALRRSYRHIALHVGRDRVGALAEVGAAEGVSRVGDRPAEQVVVPIDLTGITLSRAVDRGNAANRDAQTFPLHRLEGVVLAIGVVGVKRLSVAEVDADAAAWADADARII